LSGREKITRIKSVSTCMYYRTFTTVVGVGVGVGVVVVVVVVIIIIIIVIIMLMIIIITTIDFLIQVILFVHK
jgi:hypothetical protein